MTVNELLLWMSARTNGSWPQFRTAVEALNLERETEADGDDISLALHQQVRFNLERLGHVEFNASGCANGWRVVPPILALTEDLERSTGVLCGARTPKLLKRLIPLANGLNHECISQANCPDVHRISASNPESLIEVATEAGILHQTEAPATLLSYLPKLDLLQSWPRGELPRSGREWEVKEFVIKGRSIKWSPLSLKEANRPGAEGLFCFTRFQTPQYFIRRGEETIRIPGAIGKYYLLSRRQVMKYDRKTKQLRLPAICRPPLLIERALILCSGIPPSISVKYGRTTLTYRDIPEDIAGMAAEVLHQDLL